MGQANMVAEVSKSGLHNESYQSLKSQVQQLKCEHQQVLGSRRTAKQLENLAHLQYKDESQHQKEAYLEKIYKLQASLQEATERSGRIRQQYERAQRVLQAKADRLAKQLEEQRDSLSNGNEVLKQHHAEQLHAVQLELENQLGVQAAQAEQWNQDRRDMEVQAATWCQNQVQMVRTEAQQAVAAAESDRDMRLSECEQYKRELVETRERNRVLDAELRQEQLGRAEVTGSMARLREELEESKAANAKLQVEQTHRQQEWQQQILRSQAEHDFQLAEYSQQKLQDMQAVHTRFKEVLQKKDDSHANTRQQLKEALKQAEHYERLFAEQRMRFLQLTSQDSQD